MTYISSSSDFFFYLCISTQTSYFGYLFSLTLPMTLYCLQNTVTYISWFTFFALYLYPCLRKTTYRSLNQTAGSTSCLWTTILVSENSHSTEKELKFKKLHVLVLCHPAPSLPHEVKFFMLLVFLSNQIYIYIFLYYKKDSVNIVFS